VVEICYRSLENPREESMKMVEIQRLQIPKIAKILIFDEQISVDLFKTLGRPHTALN